MICLIQSPASSLPWLDVVGAVLIGGGALLGFWRGLWWQVVRLLGVVGAIGLARAATPLVWERLATFFPSLPERLAHGLTWFALFVAGLVVASLLGLIGKKSLEIMQLGLADRMGGALAGLLTGAAVQTALVVGLLHFAPRAFSNEALDGTTSASLFDALGDRVPLVVDEEAARNLKPWLERDPPPETADSAPRWPEDGWLSRELRAQERTQDGEERELQGRVR